MNITASSNYKDWKNVPISSVVFFQEGPGVRKHQYTSSGIKLLNGGNINNGILSLDSTDRYISEKEACGRYEHFLVEEGDLLIACSGVVVEKFDGKIAYAKREHLPLCMNTSTMRFRTLDPNKLDIDYFRRFLASNLFKNQLQKLITGSAQLNFGPSHIKQMFVPLPPLPEQKRIAAILDKADSLRRKNQQAIQLADKFLRAVFLDMFGDPVTNPKGWEEIKLGRVCDVGSSKRVFVNEFTDTGIPFYRGTEVGKLGDSENIQPHLFISNEHYENLKNHSGVPEVGDLLMPSICHDGRIWKVDHKDPFYFKDGRVLWIKVNQSLIDSDYLRCYLKHLFLTNYSSIASGTTFAELKIVNLKDVSVFNPPLDLQIKFSAITNKVIKNNEVIKSSIGKSDEMFSVLSQKAFAGEL